MALFGHAAIAELSPVSGIRRKLDFEPAKGSFWRKAAGHGDVRSWWQNGPATPAGRGRLLTPKRTSGD